MLASVVYRLMPCKLMSVTTAHNVKSVPRVNGKKKKIKPLQFYNVK